MNWHWRVIISSVILIAFGSPIAAITISNDQIKPIMGDNLVVISAAEAADEGSVEDKNPNNSVTTSAITSSSSSSSSSGGSRRTATTPAPTAETEVVVDTNAFFGFGGDTIVTSVPTPAQQSTSETFEMTTVTSSATPASRQVPTPTPRFCRFPYDFQHHLAAFDMRRIITTPDTSPLVTWNGLQANEFYSVVIRKADQQYQYGKYANADGLIIFETPFDVPYGRMQIELWQYDEHLRTVRFDVIQQIDIHESVDEFGHIVTPASHSYVGSVFDIKGTDVSGQTTPYAAVFAYVDDAVIERTFADRDGLYKLSLPDEITTGLHTLRVQSVDCGLARENYLPTSEIYHFQWAVRPVLEEVRGLFSGVFGGGFFS